MPGTAPVRAEAILLIILVFAGVNVAWLLLFEGAPSVRPPTGAAPESQRLASAAVTGPR